MYSFCPHCGQTLSRGQTPGQMLVCGECGRRIGLVAVPEKPRVRDETDELLRRGEAARCPLCRQVVQLKAAAYVPHFAAPAGRKMCPQSGKPIAPPAAAPAPSSPGKDLAAFRTKEVFQAVLFRKDAQPRLEQWTLEYRDKPDRVRLQIETVREVLGLVFRMKPYPPAFARPALAVWGNDVACVIAKKNDQGGYLSLTAEEVARILADYQNDSAAFFA